MTRQTARTNRSARITSTQPQDVVLYVNESVRLEVMNREVARQTAVLFASYSVLLVSCSSPSRDGSVPELPVLLWK